MFMIAMGNGTYFSMAKVSEAIADMSAISLLLAEDSWVLRLLANQIGYVSFAIPVTILFLISKKSTYHRWPKSVRFFLNPLIGLFIGDHSNGELLPRDANDAAAFAHPPDAPAAAAAFTQRRIFRLVFSFFGLQISYLLWGLLQERIMTQTYDDEKFNNSQFLVFVNRFLATLIAYISVRIWSATRKSSNARAPLFCYGIISYANCMSTWFQYESLLYISFPVQVIAKSIKTIPVMLVGRFVSGKTYPVRQYVLMLIMASGIALFLTGYEEGGSKGGLLKKAARHLSPITTFNGFILLTCYLGFDAFTSNYQKNVFDRYSISFLNMMLYVNFVSTILSIASLVFNGTLWDCLAFMQNHHDFAVHVFATSICSSVGQLFIFSTIEEFGPVIFTIIMTVRQAFSILLSCLFYGHYLTLPAILGIQIAFGAIFFHAWDQFKRSKPKSSSPV